jgi:hypothetical protein
LRFKKKKNDKRRCDDNFVAAVERKTSRPKGNSGKPTPTRDHFEKLLDASCSHHEVPVKHTLRECRLMKNYVKSTLKPKTADHLLTRTMMARGLSSPVKMERCI